MVVATIHPTFNEAIPFPLTLTVRSVMLRCHEFHMVCQTSYGHKELRRGVMRMDNIIPTHQFRQLENIARMIISRSQLINLRLRDITSQLLHQRSFLAIEHTDINLVAHSAESGRKINDNNLCPTLLQRRYDL